MKLSCLIFALLSQLSFADFLPPNELWQEDSLEATSNIAETEFNQVIDAAIEVYAPIVAQHGGRLVFNRYWSSSTVNASASQSGSTWYVNMYGGLARRPEVTVDGFALVVCHELGHHLGGFPQYNRGWASNEGQADYFSTQACTNLIWNDGDQSQDQLQIPSYPKNLCDKTYYGAGYSRIKLCYREMAAGFSLGNLLGRLGGDTVHFDTPDKSVVTSTKDSHPKGQCRLDTYMAGALCKIEFNPDLIPKTERQAVMTSCHSSEGDTVGIRPKCWYKARVY